MLQVQNLRKSFGVTAVLNDVSLVLNDGEKVGLVGPNGVGKSTLLRCVVSQEPLDSGHVVLSPANLILGYLPQSTDRWRDQTIQAVLAESLGGWFAARADLAAAANRLAESDDDTALQDYARAAARFEAAGDYEREAKIWEVLSGIGLGSLELETPVSHLSGGQKTRLALASLLLLDADVLILDEPTNHLDIGGLTWLEGFIRNYPGTVLIASHDREFLNQTVSRILYFDPQSHPVTSYAGNYDAFATARRNELERQQELWIRQQEYVDRVQDDISRLKGEALTIERTTSSRQPGVRKLAKRKARIATSREHKLEKFLQSDARIEKPRLTWNLHLDFGEPPPAGERIVQLRGVSFGYPGQPDLLTNVQLDIHAGERIALTGPNGAGKTTLLRLVEGKVTPRRGLVKLGTGVKPGVLAQEQETLDPGLTVLETILREHPLSLTEARNFLHSFLFAGDEVYRKVVRCSLGEQTRLQLACLVLKGCNLLLLDEPLNHLDIEGREHFEKALRAFSGTVLVVAHDRAFLQSYAERVVDIQTCSV